MTVDPSGSLPTFYTAFLPCGRPSTEEPQPPPSIRQLKRVDYQHLEDKGATKLPHWRGRNITTTDRATLVKSVLTSLVIYHITLCAPRGALRNINKIERAFLWSASAKTIRVTCKVNWERVCRPTQLCGLGILHLAKFARPLRLRCLWVAWKDPTKLAYNLQ